MRVALFLTGYVPTAGGGYTFQTDVYRAFLDAAAARRHEFTVLCETRSTMEFVRGFARPDNVHIAEVRRAAGDRVAVALRRELPPARLLLRRPGPIERAARAARAEMLWYVGGGAYETTDVPYVATVWDVQHRSHPWFPEVSARGQWERREAVLGCFLQRASVVITGTAAGQAELSLHYQVPKERIRILPHPTPAFAVDAAVGEPPALPPRFGLQPGYLLYPAQFWPHKNHANLLLALKRLRDDHRWDAPLVLVGSDKGNESYVRDLAAAHGLTSLVRFLGFVTQDELVALYRNALALVYVSWSGPENLPPLEALALGCPVVASRIAGADEQLGESAALVDPGQPDDIASAIRVLGSEPLRRTRLIERGRQRATSWTGRHYAEGVLSIFDTFEPIRRSWGR